MAWPHWCLPQFNRRFHYFVDRYAVRTRGIQMQSICYLYAGWAQSWFNVGPTSETLALYWASSGAVCRVLLADKAISGRIGSLWSREAGQLVTVRSSVRQVLLDCPASGHLTRLTRWQKPGWRACTIEREDTRCLLLGRTCQQTQNISINCVRCTLYKYHTNVLCLLGCQLNGRWGCGPL